MTALDARPADPTVSATTAAGTTATTSTTGTTSTAVSVRRGDIVLRPDSGRVVTRLFLPGQELLPDGVSRADVVLQRILALTDEQVDATLAATLEGFGSRHRELRATFVENFALVAHRLPDGAAPSAARRELIGAYSTQEYAVEAAALFNPSMVAHPDQTGLAAGELRFVMSVRAVGEGHVSSVEFRTGTVGPGDRLRVDDPGRDVVAGRSTSAAVSRDFVRDVLSARADAPLADHVLALLPERFDAGDLSAALASVRRERLTRGSSVAAVEALRSVASGNYQLSFPGDRPLSARVLTPTSAEESHGIEDARFTRFVGDDATVSYFATYTAFDGARVAPRLFHTTDFATFDSAQLTGPAAQNKGMALFPRHVGGRFLALARWDRESIDLAASDDITTWHGVGTIQTPEQPWDLIQLGNCGPPLETERGWLVLTHGVGPMRTYGIGAILLDLDDPARMIGSLDTPLLTPDADERDGYVPNVVYSCGALVHGDTLVLPYGCSDFQIRFAFVGLGALLDRLTAR